MAADVGQKLVTAAAAGNKEQAERLLASENADIEFQDSEGIRPLMAAARSGQLKVIQRLLEIREPSLNAMDVTGRTALDHAIEGKRDEVIEFMTSNPDLLGFYRGILPAVMRASAEDVCDILKSAEAYRSEKKAASSTMPWADVNTQDSRGASLLHCAIKTASKSVLEVLLLQSGIEVNVLDRYGRTPLDAAEASNHEDFAQMIRAKGGLTSTELD
eukprot:TRINITY_DN101987_c0_g1_i1.p1 TRINITY_DN101987_c0_g1~~TRINITY_DN101987_c0_g1_i1.p1  ORF type:complete len:216 (-),score=36.21 TRINITY_DN101987_c0_g1_i1:70-717(-)